MKKRILSLLLTLLLLAPSVISCAETTVEENAEETQASPEISAEPTAETVETAEERVKPDIPETADFGGDDIHFMFWSIASWGSGVHESRDIYAESLNGEGINDAVYNRNVKIEEAYKVKISLDILAHDTIVNTINSCVRSGDATYDVVYPRLADSASLFTNNSLTNLHEVPNIDLTKPWWEANCADALTVYGYLPCIATSINVNDKDATAAMAFNKQIAVDYNIEDLYTAVREGRWTYDLVTEVSDAVDTDLNGDGVIKEGDLIGFLGMRDVMESYFYGSGSQHVSKTEDGGIAFSFGTERDINVTQTIMDLMAQPWFYNSQLKSLSKEGRNVFSEGNVFLFWIRLSEVTNMREGEADFGILPIPKYEESQENYYSMVSRHSTALLSIPTTAHGEKLDQLGIVLEALAAESHYTLIPEYIETSLKTKHSRDAESADMLDIIISSRIYDAIYIYNIGSFADAYLVMGEPGQENVSSFLRGKQKAMNKNVEKFLESLAKNIGLNAGE
jgi:ABC-type glycerol-3-phosphate transport system substrate-binding protein